MEIVGVVANVRAVDPALPPQPQLFMPFEQHPLGSTALTLVMRTGPDPLRLSPAVVEKVRAVNGDVPVRVSTMDATLEQAVSTPWFRTVLLGIFAAVALLLAMAGVYGVVSFMVSQRTSELGLRMALGAQPFEIVKLTVLSGLRPTLIGVVARLGRVAGARAQSSRRCSTRPAPAIRSSLPPFRQRSSSPPSSPAPRRPFEPARVDPVVAFALNSELARVCKTVRRYVRPTPFRATCEIRSCKSPTNS